jgi:hypothetical protein
MSVCPRLPGRKERRTRTKEIRPLSGLYEAAAHWIVHAQAVLRRGLLDVVVLNLYVSQVACCIKRLAIAGRVPESQYYVACQERPLLVFIFALTNKCVGAHFCLLSGRAANAKARAEVAVG